MISLVEKDFIESVNQNIITILTTIKGSDIHRPDFGSDVWQWLDKPLTALTVGKIKAEVVDAIETWEHRVIVESVELKKNYSDVVIKITYKVKESEEVFELWI